MIINKIKKLFPEVEENLKKARIKLNVVQYTKKAILFSTLIPIVLIFTLIIFIKISLINTILLFLICYMVSLVYIMNMPAVYVKRKEVKINQNLLFLARYLLIKVESGVPLFNALETTSKKFGDAGKVIQEIIRETRLGTPMETAIDNAIDNCPSENFSRLLFEIINALKTGVDISTPLKAMITDLTKQHIIEIERYSKKLNSLTMFYMLMAIVIPSLGTTLFVIITGFIGLDITLNFMMVLAFFLVIIQFLFLSLFRAIRPMVEL